MSTDEKHVESVQKSIMASVDMIESTLVQSLHGLSEIKDAVLRTKDHRVLVEMYYAITDVVRTAECVHDRINSDNWK